MREREPNAIEEDVFISEHPSLNDDYMIFEVDTRVHNLEKIAEDIERKIQLEKERVRRELVVMQEEKPAQTEIMCKGENDRFVRERVVVYREDDEFRSDFALNPSSQKRSIAFGEGRLFNNLIGRDK